MSWQTGIQNAVMPALERMLPDQANAQLIRKNEGKRDPYFGEPDGWLEDIFEIAAVISPYPFVYNASDCGVRTEAEAFAIWSRPYEAPKEGDYLKYNAVLYRITKIVPYELNNETRIFEVVLSRIIDQNEAGV